MKNPSRGSHGGVASHKLQRVNPGLNCNDSSIVSTRVDCHLVVPVSYGKWLKPSCRFFQTWIFASIFASRNRPMVTRIDQKSNPVTIIVTIPVTICQSSDQKSSAKDPSPPFHDSLHRHGFTGRGIGKISALGLRSSTRLGSCPWICLEAKVRGGSANG